MILKAVAKQIVYRYYKKKFRYLGDNTKINPTSSIHNKQLISIGEHSFIGKWCHISIVEPATVTKDVLPYSVAVGSPAKMVKLRFTLNNIKRHMQSINSHHNFDKLTEQYQEAGLITI